jgi:hypothetical protein
LEAAELQQSQRLHSCTSEGNGTGATLSRAEWVFLAQYVQVACEERPGNTSSPSPRTLSSRSSKHCSRCAPSEPAAVVALTDSTWVTSTSRCLPSSANANSIREFEARSASLTADRFRMADTSPRRRRRPPQTGNWQLLFLFGRRTDRVLFSETESRCLDELVQRTLALPELRRCLIGSRSNTAKYRLQPAQRKHSADGESLAASPRPPDHRRLS